MFRENNCCCVVCQVERSLLNSLSTQASRTQFQAVARTYPILNHFDSPADVIAQLHGQAEPANHEAWNEILHALLDCIADRSGEDIGQQLLLAAYAPAIHKVYREVCQKFPGLSPEDIATGDGLFLGNRAFRRDADPEWPCARRTVETISPKAFSLGHWRTQAITPAGGDCWHAPGIPSVRFRGRHCPRTTSVESAAHGHSLCQRKRTRAQVSSRRVSGRGTAGEQRWPVGHRALLPHPEGCASSAPDRRNWFA